MGELWSTSEFSSVSDSSLNPVNISSWGDVTNVEMNITSKVQVKSITFSS